MTSGEASAYAPEIKAAADALRAGRVSEAETRIAAALAADPGDADALNLRAALLAARGAYLEALDAAERAAARRPDDLRLKLNCAAMLVNVGRLEEALELFDAALARAPDHVRALHDRGRTLLERRRVDEAVADLRRAAEFAPQDGAVRASLAEALLEAGAADEAETTIAASAALGEASARAASVRGRIKAARGDFDAAEAAFRAAIEADPAFSSAYSGLAAAALARGDDAAAAEATERLIARQPIARRQVGAAEARLLVLDRLGGRPVADFRPSLFPQASSNYIGEMPAGRIAYLHAFADHPKAAEAAKAALGEAQAIYNNWANAEASAGGDAALRAVIAAAPHLPVINAPDAVAETTRFANAAAHAYAARFTFPTTLRVPARRRNGVDAALTPEARSALVLERLRPPLIVRTVNQQRGAGAVRVDDEAALLEALSARAGVDLYAIAYVDCGRDDGIFRRYRVAVIGDDVLPSNMHARAGWNVHAEERESLGWRESGLEKEELAFIAEPEALLGDAPARVFADILNRVRLDVYGIDFGVARDGRVIVFEVNAAMAFSSVQLVNRFPQLRPSRAAVVAATEALFLRRARDG